MLTDVLGQKLERARARELGLANADKAESQEICFVPHGDYARFVERAAAPERLRPGSIVDLKGQALAAHAGVHRFTVGQRRGLGLSASAPLYVREIRAASGEVVVGPREELVAVGLLGALTHQAVAVMMPVRQVAGPGGFVTRFRAVPAAGYATADSKTGKSVSKSVPQAF